MKKLLLSIFLSVLMFGSAFSQIRWGTYTSNTQNGQTLKAVNTTNKDTLILDFVTIPTTPVCAWAKAKATANLGKDSVYKKTLQTQRGIQVKGYYSAASSAAIVEDGSFKCNNAGGNGNPGRIASIDSLKKYLTHSVITGTLNGSVNDSLTKPAACLFDYGTGDVAFGMWPGRCTRIEYLYRFDYTGKACPDDITFDIWTYDAGNTSKTATYTIEVYSGSSYSSTNLIGDTAILYTSGDPKKNVNLATTIGVSPSSLSNKNLYIVIKTLGTNNNGAANPVDASNIPTLYDPTIVFDNFVAIYASSSWTAPTGAVANAYINHNNGSPVVTTSTDFTGGSPVIVPGGSDQPIKMYLNSKDRMGTIVIIEGNDGGGHAAGFSFAETGAIKKNDGSGNYTIDVAYTRGIDVVSGKYTLTVPAPSSGSVTEDLEITILGNVGVGSTRAIRLELTNGIRFWYNVSITADTWTSNHIINLDNPMIWTAHNTIFVSNNKNNVQILNLAGQKVKSLSAQDATKGISLKSGVYIVKSGSYVQKVIVD